MKANSAALLLILAVGSLGGCNDKKSEAPNVVDAAKPQAEANEKETEALKAGVEAVVCGLPLMMMDISKEKMTNVARSEAFAAPINQFAGACQKFRVSPERLNMVRPLPL